MFNELLVLQNYSSLSLPPALDRCSVVPHYRCAIKHQAKLSIWPAFEMRAYKEVLPQNCIQLQNPQQ